MTGDVTVLGLHPVSCHLEDIAMDVPHGTSVVIPADKAARSKDLWRAVSQRLLFRLDNGLTIIQNGAPNPLTSEITMLRERIRALEEENRTLRAELAHQDAASQGKLDAILSMLQKGPALRMEIPSEGTVRPMASGVVEVAPPPYIPSQIRSEVPLDAHVQAETGSSEATNVSEATSELRRFRQRGGQ